MPAGEHEPINLHGTALAVAGRAVLIRGPSGSGKSDLALRVLGLCPGPLVAAQPMLVADDRVLVCRNGDRLDLTCPGGLERLLEVRGIGIVTVPSVPLAVLELVVDLVAPADVERMPLAPDCAEICGLQVPRVRLAPFEPSAPLKLLMALSHTDGRS